MLRIIVILLLSVLFQLNQLFAIEAKHDTTYIKNLIAHGESEMLKSSDSSIFALKDAMALSSELNYKSGYINAGFLLAKVYKQKGLPFDAIKTIEYLQKYSEVHNLIELKGECLYTLGEINRSAFKTDIALNLLFEALSIFKELHNHEKQADCYNRISAVLFEEKMMNLSTAYADSSNRIAIPLKKYKLVSSNDELIGAVYRRTHSHKEAIKKLESALRWAVLSGDSTDIPNIYNNFGYTYFEMKNFDKAIEFALKSFEISKKKEIFVYSTSAAQILSFSYIAKNQLEIAFEYQRYKDSLSFNIETKNRNRLVMDINEKFEAKQKEQQRVLLQKENALKSETIKNQKYQFISSLILLLILSIGIFIILLGRYRISNANKALKQQKEEIQNQNQQLSESYTKLKKLQAFKEDLSSMLVHDLKNPINTIMNISVIDDVPDKNKLIYETGREMNNLVMNILDVTKYENTTMHLKKELVSLTELIDDALNDVWFLGTSRDVVFAIDLINNLKVNLDKNIMHRVMVNLLTNAIKFSPLMGKIEISTHLDRSDFIKISVKNNGPGISPERQRTIFDRYQSETIKDSLILSTGLGLTFCKLAVESHGGVITVESVDMQGANFIVYIPLAESASFDIQNIKKETNTQRFEDDVLDKDDIEAILPLIEELKEFEVYQLSDIFRVLQQVKSLDSIRLQKWAMKVKNAVLLCQQSKYNELVNITRNE